MARDGCSIQSLGRPEPSKVARSVVPEQRADARRIVRAPRHDAAGGHQASPVAGEGEPGGGGLARAREAALSESGAVARDQRALDWQIRTPSPAGARRSEKGSRTNQNQPERISHAKAKVSLRNLHSHHA